MSRLPRAVVANPVSGEGARPGVEQSFLPWYATWEHGYLRKERGGGSKVAPSCSVTEEFCLVGKVRDKGQAVIPSLNAPEGNMRFRGRSEEEEARAALSLCMSGFLLGSGPTVCARGRRAGKSPGSCPFLPSRQGQIAN
jgi:hypothetical protein